MRYLIVLALAVSTVTGYGQSLRQIDGPVHRCTIVVGPGAVTAQSIIATIYKTGPLTPYQYVSQADGSGILDDLHMAMPATNPLYPWADVASITFGLGVVGSGTVDIEMVFNIPDWHNFDAVGPLVADFYLAKVQVSAGVTFITVVFDPPYVEFTNDVNLDPTSGNMFFGLRFDHLSGVSDIGWLVASSPVQVGTSHDLYARWDWSIVSSPWSGNPPANFDPVIEIVSDSPLLFGKHGVGVPGASPPPSSRH